MYDIVLSYSNPDTDGIACTIAVAKLYGYTPVMQGRLFSETAFVLKKIGINAPKQIQNCREAHRIILVDTHHLSQLGKDFPVDSVVGIIDHHPGGNGELFKYAKIDNRSIGAAASIVGELFLQEGIEDEKVYRLLQYAIVSNTLNFTAPSTTDFDKKIFKRLNEKYPVSEDELHEMLSKRIFEGYTLDTKIFDFQGGRVGIAQIEKEGLKVPWGKVRKELDELNLKEGLLFSVFNGVDIRKGKSTVVFSSGIDDSKIMSIFGFKAKDGVYKSDRVMLRKKDFVPALICYID